MSWFGARMMMFQGLHFLFILLWLGLSAAALFSLRKRSMNEVARVLWVALIVALPVLGAVSFWIVNPGEGQGGAAG